MSVDKEVAVRKMQAYITKHIYEKITLNDLAKASAYSQYYASRIFKEYTGCSPFNYIKGIRLSEAAMILRDTDMKILDVAFDFVFDSHEGFTRAFSKYFGLTPSKYSETTPPIRLFTPSEIDNPNLEKRSYDMTKTVFTQVIERPKRKLILKRGIKATHYFEYCDEVGCDVWGILTSIKEALYEPIGVWLPEDLRKEGTSEYAQGVEVPMDYNNEIPEGFEVIVLEPCKVMIFQGEPYDDDYFREEVSEVMDAIKKYDPTIYGFKWLESKCPRFQLAPQGYRGYIEGKPVEEINK